ncbi:TPA: hypothetical protein ACGOSV_000198 [Streptococcus suis]
MEERVEVLYRYLVQGESSTQIAETYYMDKFYFWKILAITQGYGEKGGDNRGQVSATRVSINNFIETYPNGTYDIGLTLSDWLKNTVSEPSYMDEFHKLMEAIEKDELEKEIEKKKIIKQQSERINNIFSKFHNTQLMINYNRPITLLEGTTRDVYGKMLNELFPNRISIYETKGFYDIDNNNNIAVRVFFYQDFVYIIEEPYFGHVFNGKEYVEGVTQRKSLFDILIRYKDIKSVNGSFVRAYNETKASTSEWAYSDTYETTYFYLGQVRMFSTYYNDEKTEELLRIVNNIVTKYKENIE